MPKWSTPTISRSAASTPPANWSAACSISIIPAARGSCRAPCSAGSPALPPGAPARTERRAMDVKVKRGFKELSATEIVAKIAAGETTCEAVTRDCIERIAAREAIVKAWVNFNPELALAQAHALDREPRRGSLHGVPIGVKDVIDTFDMPTEMGSPIYRGYRPLADAACVALLRRAGAVILGKTATCELAGMAPAATTNPHNAAHTPGGSSSGSAAAVADLMVSAALGTPDRRFGVAAILVLRRVRLQADLQHIQQSGAQSRGRKHRHDRMDRTLDRGHRAANRHLAP